jgi:hypothetical protein
MLPDQNQPEHARSTEQRTSNQTHCAPVRGVTEAINPEAEASRPKKKWWQQPKRHLIALLLHHAPNAHAAVNRTTDETLAFVASIDRVKRSNSRLFRSTIDKKRGPDAHFTPRIFWLVSRSLWNGNAIIDLYRHGFFPSKPKEWLGCSDLFFQRQ